MDSVKLVDDGSWEALEIKRELVRLDINFETEPGNSMEVHFEPREIIIFKSAGVELIKNLLHLFHFSKPQ